MTFTASGITGLSHVAPDPSDQVISDRVLSLEGVGVVTNNHVLIAEEYEPELNALEEMRGPGFTVVFRARPAMEFTWCHISVLRVSSHHDLAIIEPEGSAVVALKVASRNAEPGDRVILAGFPGWTEGDYLRIEPCTITKNRVRSGVQWKQVSGTIHAGNSGGPILDVEGRVLAVATVGAEGTMPHAAVSIEHLKDCKDN